MSKSYLLLLITQLLVMPASTVWPGESIETASGMASQAPPAEIVLSPKATGTIAFYPELRLFQMPVGSALQSVYFKTTTLNRSFRRGFIEFELPEIAGPVQQAHLILTENRGWTSFPKPAVAHELSFYRADLKVTHDDYFRATSPLFYFETDENEPTKIITADVTRALTEITEGPIGFRIKLRPDPEYNHEDSFGTGFHSIDSGATPRLVIKTGAVSAATVRITNPADGETFNLSTVVPIKAVAIDPRGYISRLEFLANDRRIGVSEIAFIREPDPGEPIHHQFEWEPVEPGVYSIVAAGKDSQGNSVTSPPVRITIARHPEPPSPGAIRELPLAYSPSVPVTVELKILPPRGTQVYAVEDQPPRGWAVGPDVSQDGVFDRATGKVKFGPFFDDQQRVLRYVVVPPADARGVGIFLGAVGFDGVIQTILGASRLAAGIRHPADIHPADNAINLKELTEYGLAWKTGKRWIHDPNPIPVSYVTRAGALWRGGETYIFDPNAGDPPLWWVNTPAVGPQNLNPRITSLSAPSRAIRMQSRQSTGKIRTTIQITPHPLVASYAVEEKLPAHAMAAEISDSGSYDPESGLLRWGPFLYNQPRTLAYSSVPADHHPLSFSATGTASFDGHNIAIEQSSGGSAGIHAAPKIHSIQLHANGGFQLTCSGNPGEQHHVEVSSDLLQWREVTRITPPESTFQVTGPTGGHHTRFYRIRVTTR
jgi:hypothetical protein